MDLIFSSILCLYIRGVRRNLIHHHRFSRAFSKPSVPAPLPHREKQISQFFVGLEWFIQKPSEALLFIRGHPIADMIRSAGQTSFRGNHYWRNPIWTMPSGFLENSANFLLTLRPIPPPHQEKQILGFFGLLVNPPPPNNLTTRWINKIEKKPLIPVGKCWQKILDDEDQNFVVLWNFGIFWSPTYQMSSRLLTM